LREERDWRVEYLKKQGHGEKSGPLKCRLEDKQNCGAKRSFEYGLSIDWVLNNQLDASDEYLRNQ
jgi:hypothetical protein